MAGLKTQICEWLEQGNINAQLAKWILTSLAPGPDGESWQRLIASLLLWFGCLGLGAGVIFFFAYNWDDLSRFQQFALLEVGLLISIAAYCVLMYRSSPQCLSLLNRTVSSTKIPPASPHLGATPANALLVLASLLVGALLALVGQTYQTGADPWQLFILWAVLIFPWAWVAGFQGLWLLWCGLLNLGGGLYLDTLAPVWMLLDSDLSPMLWLVLLNLSIFFAFAYLAAKPANTTKTTEAVNSIPINTRFHAPWVEYVSVTLATSGLTWLAILAVLDLDAGTHTILSLYVLYVMVVFGVCRYGLLRFFPLVLLGFSVIAVVGAFFLRLMFEGSESIGAVFFIALYFICASTGLSIWLKKQRAQLLLAMATSANVLPITPQRNESGVKIDEPTTDEQRFASQHPVFQVSQDMPLPPIPSAFTVTALQATEANSLSAIPLSSAVLKSAASLWQFLGEQGLVSQCQAPESTSSPWYMLVMQAFFAWVSAGFLLIFVALFFEAFFSDMNSTHLLIVGGLYLAFGVALYSSRQFQQHSQRSSSPEFTSQFAFAITLTSMLVMAWGLYDVFDDDSVLWYAMLATLSFFLWLWVKDNFSQLGFALIACGLVMGGLNKGLLADFVPALFVCASSGLLLLLHTSTNGIWLTHYRRVRHLAYALIICLYSVQWLQSFGLYHEFGQFMQIGAYALGGDSLNVLLVLMMGCYLLWMYAAQRQITTFSLSYIACFMALVLLGALSLPMLGLSTAVLYILLAHYCNEPLLKGLSIFSALGFICGYYYSLETTLMYKSLLLMGMGGTLLLARYLLWHYVKNANNTPTSVQEC